MPHPFAASILLFSLIVSAVAGQPALRDRQKLQQRFVAEAELLETLRRQPAEKIERSSRTEREEEKAHSLALFGKGRLLFQQERYDEALSSYQRAWQWNPEATSILHEIVRLTFHLERHGAAIRYAILANELSPKDPDMMQQLSMVLAQDGEPARGLDMLNQALKLRPEPRDKTYAEMHFNILRLAALSGREKEALDSIDVIRRAHRNHDAFEIPEEELDEIIGERRLVQGLFVEIYLASQELDAAEQAIDELARLEENNALVDYYRARLAFKADQPEKCIEHLETYAKSEGTTAGEDAYELLEKALKKTGKSEKEIAARLQRLADKDPANADLALYTARKFNALGDAENVQLLVEPLAAKPDLEAYRLLLDSYIAQERVGPLVALLGRIVETFGNITVFSEQVEKITNNEELSKKTFDEATRRLNDRRRPMLANESLGCSYLALANEDVKLSEKFFAHAEKNLPEEDLTTTRLGYAEECFFSEQNEPAIRIFRDVLQHPNDEVNLDSVVELLAMALEYDGQTEAALQIVDEHIKDNPSVGLAIRRAWIHYHAKQNDAARDAYESAINQYNDNFESTATRRTLKDARMVLSNLYVAEGNIDLGTELLLQVLDEYPEDVGAMNDLGYLWSDNGIHLERSLSMIKKAVKAEPENAAYLDSLAWVYVKMNRPSEALPYLEEAIAGQDEPDGVILDHLGDVHLQLGNNDKAIQFWKQSLTSLGENDQPEKLKSVESKIQKHSKK